MPELEELQLEARIGEMLNRHPAVGLAAGVVRGGSMEYFHAHGLADIASKTPITEDTVFRIASISKTFTAVAVMQLWERGLIDLDAPASDYLRAYRLVPAKASFRPATVRHLLTHTSGAPETLHPWGALRPDFGQGRKAGRPVPSLAEYYRKGLRLDVEPGTRYRYTDHGFATLGQIVEDVSGQPFGRYLREHIFGPLGMADTDLFLPERLAARLATGYVLRPGGPKPVKVVEWVTAGASSIYSTPKDMARYLAALLGGAGEHGPVLKPATLATMFDGHYRSDPRSAGVGLAFFRGDAGGHLVVEHQGRLPAFKSQIFLAPGDGLGVMAFTNGARGATMWLPAELSGLLSHLLGVPAEAIRTGIPQHPEIWGELCGWYYLPGRLSDVTMRGMLGAGFEVFTRGGKLMLRALSPLPVMYRGAELHPDDDTDPYVFRIDLSRYAMPSVRVFFSREPHTGATSVTTEFMPLTAYKQPAETNPRRWATGALTAAAAAIAARRVRGTRRHRGRRTAGPTPRS
jgi:CubicO group peptidase (beta-lactamase class C family)